jgi:hypothetical protein
MKDLEKEFVPYQPSLDMKELGFDEPCFGLWNINNGKYEADIIGICKYSKDFKYRELLAPTFSQCFKWFREKYGLFIQPNRTIDSEGTWYYFSIASKRTDVCDGSFVYEEAELACLIKLIEIVKENKQ